MVCGDLEADPADARGHTVVNPSFAAEVLNPSTEDYDRGEKLSQYKTIESLEEIALVAHDARRVELWRRQGQLWVLDVTQGEETAPLQALGCDVPLLELYEDWVA